MLHIGLTGNLGSGKSTVATLFAQKGAHLLASDAIGRDLMQPGQPVFQKIVDRFGPGILTATGELNRPALARIAFTEGRAEELNAIVHPAVIARQAELAEALSNQDPRAILIVESALIFESRHFTGTKRFDKILLVTAPESQKIARFTQRTGLPPEEAHRRLALQIPDAAKRPLADYLIENDGSLAHLEAQVDALWPLFKALAAQ
jgi:dephospho-CoA kinase